MCYQDTIQWFWNPSSQQAKCCLCESERFLVLGARGVTKVYLKIFMNMIMNVFKGTIGFGMLCSRHSCVVRYEVTNSCNDIGGCAVSSGAPWSSSAWSTPQGATAGAIGLSGHMVLHRNAGMTLEGAEVQNLQDKKVILYIIHYIIYMYI